MSDEKNNLTQTEMLSCFVGQGRTLCEIRTMAYETGKKRFIMKGYTAREASKMAGEYVAKFDEEMDSIFL